MWTYKDNSNLLCARKAEINGVPQKIFHSKYQRKSCRTISCSSNFSPGSIFIAITSLHLGSRKPEVIPCGLIRANPKPWFPVQPVSRNARSRYSLPMETVMKFYPIRGSQSSFHGKTVRQIGVSRIS